LSIEAIIHIAKGERMKIHVDGGARGNPGPAAIGAVLDDGRQQVFISEYIGRATNNIAEYTALQRALEKARELKADSIQVFSDSELMVKQLTGIYKVKNENIKKIYNSIKSLATGFSKIEYVHVRRQYNKEADSLVNKALDERG
jgi:ribonuclease HI